MQGYQMFSEKGNLRGFRLTVIGHGITGAPVHNASSLPARKALAPQFVHQDNEGNEGLNRIIPSCWPSLPLFALF
jgi:hypothetical protein